MANKKAQNKDLNQTAKMIVDAIVGKMNQEIPPKPAARKATSKKKK